MGQISTGLEEVRGWKWELVLLIRDGMVCFVAHLCKLADISESSESSFPHHPYPMPMLPEMIRFKPVKKGCTPREYNSKDWIISPKSMYWLINLWNGFVHSIWRLFKTRSIPSERWLYLGQHRIAWHQRAQYCLMNIRIYNIHVYCVIDFQKTFFC